MIHVSEGLSITKLVETDNILLSYVISSINNFFSKKKKKQAKPEGLYRALHFRRTADCDYFGVGTTGMNFALDDLCWRDAYSFLIEVALKHWNPLEDFGRCWLPALSWISWLSKSEPETLHLWWWRTDGLRAILWGLLSYWKGHLRNHSILGWSLKILSQAVLSRVL